MGRAPVDGNVLELASEMLSVLLAVGDGEPPRRPDGTIAGANLRLDDAVARAVALGVPPADAIEAASRVPADVLGRDDLGRIEVGAAADLVWLGPGMRARATWIGGELAYGRPV